MLIYTSLFTVNGRQQEKKEANIAETFFPIIANILLRRNAEFFAPIYPARNPSLLCCAKRKTLRACFPSILIQTYLLFTTQQFHYGRNRCNSEYCLSLSIDLFARTVEGHFMRSRLSVSLSSCACVSLNSIVGRYGPRHCGSA